MRVYCASAVKVDFQELHNLCNPGVSRMMYIIRLGNLSYSIEAVKKMAEKCVSVKEKPRIMRGGKLNKATQPFERVNIVFKGPLPSNRGNIYWPSLMNIHFLPDFACREKLPTTCLSKLFYIFGMSSYIYCDRGPSFKFCVKIYFKRKEYLLVDILRTTHMGDWTELRGERAT